MSANVCISVFSFRFADWGYNYVCFLLFAYLILRYSIFIDVLETLSFQANGITFRFTCGANFLGRVPAFYSDRDALIMPRHGLSPKDGMSFWCYFWTN